MKLLPINAKLARSQRFLLLFLFIYIILSILLFDPKLFTGGDNAVYIILAESIARGRGYNNIHLPDESPHTKYPFGFPLMLSLLLLLFGSEVIVFKLLVLATGVGSCYFMYRIGQLLFKEKINLIMPFYLSLPIFIIYGVQILSETPFLCFSLGALYFFMRARADRESFYYLSLIFATYAFFIRTAGITLIIGMMGFLLLKKQYKYSVIFILLFIAVSVPWQIRNSNIPSDASYIDLLLAKEPLQIELGRVNLFDILSRLWENFIFYSFTILPKTLLPILHSSVSLSIAGLIFSGIMLIGFLKRIEKWSAIELYFVLSMVILLAWPRRWSSERFLLPILPLLIVYLFFGIRWLSDRVNFKYLFEGLTAILVLVNIVAIILTAKITIRDNIEYFRGDVYAGYEYDWRRYFETIDWVKENVPEDKIIMARKPEFVYLLSGHKSFVYPITTDHNRMRDAIARSDYIIIDNFYVTRPAKRWLFPFLQQEKEKYRLVYQTKNPQFLLMEVRK